VVEQRPLIDFTRCAKILRHIDDIRRYYPAPSPSPSPPSPPPPPPPDPLPGRAKSKDKTKTKDKDNKDKRRTGSTAAAAQAPIQPVALAWVKMELDKAPEVISREQFEARVSALAAIERQMRSRHETELRSLGFETGPRHHRTSSSGSHSSARSLGGGRTVSLDSHLEKI
jgi:hypothetical protein